jgi:hypothetical protein
MDTTTWVKLAKDIKLLESKGQIMDALVSRIEHAAIVRKSVGQCSKDAREVNLDLAERCTRRVTLFEKILTLRVVVIIVLEFGVYSVALTYLLDAAEACGFCFCVAFAAILMLCFCW